MNNQKYWEDRAVLKDKLLEKDIKKIEKKLLKLFKDTRKEVLNELKIIYADIDATEYAKYRIDSLLTSVNKALDSLYQKNEEELTKAFIDLYYDFDNEASIDINASFNTINENLIREVLKTEWSGLSFSERIWEHRRKLAFTLKSELKAGLTRGESLQDISKIISKKFDTSFSNAMRLVRTESCWIMNEATVNNYKNNGIKEYEFMAFLDSKTSKECKRLDGKKFSVEEYQAGVNFPPLHPNCRSCIIPVVEDIVIGKPKEEDVKDNTLSPMEELENKGVKVNTDSFKNIDKRLFDENAKQLNRLIDKYPKAQEYIKNNTFEFKGEKLGKYTNAVCGTNFKIDKMFISLDFKAYKEYNDLIKQTKDNILSGWHSKGKDEYLSVKTLTHEFGHFIHNIIIDEHNKKDQHSFNSTWQSITKAKTQASRQKIITRYRESIIKQCNSDINKIAKEIDKGFKPKENIISRYGATSPAEFFAECFAEYECGANTTYAKAMEIFLERNFK